MAASYDPRAMSMKDKVRLFIGDNKPDLFMLSDEEINALILQADSKLYKACGLCCLAIAGRFARHVSTKVRGESVEITNVTSKYLLLAKKFGAKSTSAASLYAVLEKAEKESLREDTTLVQPKISLGMSDPVEERVYSSNAYNEFQSS